MLKKEIFKAYDIRGIYPDEINSESASLIARACAGILSEGEIIIAYDVRRGSPELAEAVEKSLLEEAGKFGKKITVRNIGLSSTPMYYFCVNHFKASGGCMITASHNPKNYNGMKIVKAGAEMIPGLEILDYITKNKIT